MYMNRPPQDTAQGLPEFFGGTPFQEHGLELGGGLEDELGGGLEDELEDQAPEPVWDAEEDAPDWAGAPLLEGGRGATRRRRGWVISI